MVFYQEAAIKKEDATSAPIRENYAMQPVKTQQHSGKLCGVFEHSFAPKSRGLGARRRAPATIDGILAHTQGRVSIFKSKVSHKDLQTHQHEWCVKPVD